MADVIGRFFCWVGLHDCRGTDIPHTYRCIRFGCGFSTGGHN